LINDENEKTYTGKWLSPRLGFNGQKKIIPYILPVWKSDKIIGVVGIEISTDSFFSEIVRIDPSKSSYIFIAKSDGSFFSSSDKVYDDFQIDDKENGNFLDSRVIRKQGLENILSNVGKKEGTIKFTKKNTKSEFIVNYSTISSLGGKIFVVTPLEEILQIQAEKAQEIQQAVSKVGITGLLYVAGLTIFIIIVSYFLSNRTIINPIFVLQAGIESIEKNLDTKISVKNEDEFGRLAKSFNKMSENLKESRRELEKYSSDLEGLVAQRTSELEKSKQDMISKLEDLEKFNKVAVDRELKMIELKTKIKELEAQKQENTETQKQ
jgi:methyl-accepting chemotaxis protein